MNQAGFELFSFERTNSNLVLKFQMCDLLIPTNIGITMEKQNKREKENFICKGCQDGQEESLTCPWPQDSLTVPNGLQSMHPNDQSLVNDYLDGKPHCTLPRVYKWGTSK